MHEVTLAGNILETLKEKLKAHPDARSKPKTLCLGIGQIAAIDKSCLKFAFEILTKDTENENIEIVFNDIPCKVFCSNCQKEVLSAKDSFSCPICLENKTKLISGHELVIEYIEINES